VNTKCMYGIKDYAFHTPHSFWDRYNEKLKQPHGKSDRSPLK